MGRSDYEQRAEKRVNGGQDRRKNSTSPAHRNREKHKGRRDSREREGSNRHRSHRSNSREKAGDRRQEERKRRYRSRSRTRSRSPYRRKDKLKEQKSEAGNEEHNKNGRKFERMEPPPGGWDKPRWEPSGALKKEPKSEPAESDEKGMGRRGGPSAKDAEEREKPSFEPSGKLAQDTNTFKGVVIKYNEPPEAKLPKLRWRIYPFKGDEELPVIYIHRQSAYLIGRDRKIADFPMDHPSCSKQHAVIQYRSMPYERVDGTRGRRTRPYIIDLGSANGTYLNKQRIEAQRYYELKENDVLKFGFSSREYVMLHEQSVKEGGDESDTGSEEEEEEDEMNIGIDRTGGEEKLAAAEEDDLF